MFEDGDTTSAWLSIENVLNYVIIAEPVGQFFSVLLIRNIPRRKIMVIYALLIGVLNLILALFDHLNINGAIVAAVIVMTFVQACIGVPVLGLYAIEVTTNSSLGAIQLY